MSRIIHYAIPYVVAVAGCICVYSKVKDVESRQEEVINELEELKSQVQEANHKNGILSSASNFLVRQIEAGHRNMRHAFESFCFDTDSDDDDEGNATSDDKETPEEEEPQPEPAQHPEEPVQEEKDKKENAAEPVRQPVTVFARRIFILKTESEKVRDESDSDSSDSDSDSDSDDDKKKKKKKDKKKKCKGKKDKKKKDKKKK